MAEKEERILHIVQKLDGRFVGENHITRKEAIEKMAKAIFDYYTDRTEPQNWKLKEVRDNFNKVAEAALNALLK
jgi:hypothetical protein